MHYFIFVLLLFNCPTLKTYFSIQEHPPPHILYWFPPPSPFPGWSMGDRRKIRHLSASVFPFRFYLHHLTASLLLLADQEHEMDIITPT